MHLNGQRLICLLAAFVAGPALGQAKLPYSQDFEGKVGKEWSWRDTSDLDTIGDFLGPFGDVGAKHSEKVKDEDEDDHDDLDDDDDDDEKDHKDKDKDKDDKDKDDDDDDDDDDHKNHKDDDDKRRAENVTLKISKSGKRGVYSLTFDLILIDEWDRSKDEFQVKIGKRIVFRSKFDTLRDDSVYRRNSQWLDRYEDLGYGPGRELVIRDISVVFSHWRTAKRIEFLASYGASAKEKGWAIDNVRITKFQNNSVINEGVTTSWVKGVERGAAISQIDFNQAPVQTYDSQIAWLPTKHALNSSIGKDNFAWRAFAGLDIGESGEWKFRVANTNDALLSIDDTLVLKGAGGSKGVRKEATVVLAAGIHTIELRTMNLSGEAGLVLEWKGPSDKHWAVIPPTAFSHVVVSPIFMTDVTKSTGIGAATDRFVMSQTWADFNNDGFLDIILGGLRTPILFGNASGTFTAGQRFPYLYYQVAIADVDNDGDTDLLSAFRGLYENDGGVFTARGFPGLPIRYNFSVAAPDLNADGRADLAASLNWTPLIAMNENSGSSGIQYTTSAITGKLSRFARGWFFANYIDADFNNDSKTDLFMSAGRRGSGVLVSGEKGYEFKQVSSSSVGWFSLFSNSGIGDIDGDGDLDMFYGGSYLGVGNGVMLNDGTGKFVAQPNIVPDVADQRWSGATWGDIDNDGDIDLLLRTLLGRRVELRLNNGDGSFASGQEIEIGNRYVYDAVLVDYDSDGDLDISIASSQGMLLFRNDTISNNYLKVRLVGSGDGATNTDAVGTRVELYDAATRQFIARRDIVSSNGLGAGPLWVHFGGVDPGKPYFVRAYFQTEPRVMKVVPATASTTIGSTKIAQMLTVEESSGRGRRVTQWKETDQRGTIRAALKAEARRRGLQKQVVALREANQLTIRNLLQLLGAKSVRDALGDDAAVLSDLSRDPRRGNGRHGSGRNGSRGNSRAGVDQP